MSEKEKDVQDTQEEVEVEVVQEEKKSVREQVTDWEDKYRRLLADFDNCKKRYAKQQLDIYNNAKSETILNFLNIVDSCELALKNTPDDEGLQAIKKQIDAAFEKLNIEEIENKIFNPLEHNALQHEEDDTKGEGEIVEVFQKGYKIGDKIVRSSLVKSVN